MGMIRIGVKKTVLKCISLLIFGIIIVFISKKCYKCGIIKVEKDTVRKGELKMETRGGKYTVFDVAAWFLNKENMTHKRLQKLCYYAFAWDFAIRDGNLIKNCEFEAWVHGPVNDDLYQQLKGNGMKELTVSNLPNTFTVITDVDDVEFLESVWETYGSYGANALEVMTHRELPWKKARAGCDAFDRCNNVISIDDMAEYYRSIYAGEEDAA